MKTKKTKKNKPFLSLYPLEFNEAIGAILTVIPKKEIKKNHKKKRNKKSKITK